MDTAIEVKATQEVVDSQHIKVGQFGITFDGAPTIREWHETVLAVQKVHGMLQFYLGDLMVYAESPVTGWGQSKYEELIATTQYDYPTLRNYASLARRFSVGFREEIMSPRGDISFSHFKEVWSLDDVPAKYYLEQSRDQRWTVAKLREEVAKFKNRGVLPEPEEEIERPVGEISFQIQARRFFKGYVPNIVDRDYTEREWLLEVRDVIDDRLGELGIHNV